MKKIKLIIFSLLTIVLWTNTVNAASFNMSSKTSSVAPNGSFTISVGGDCIGRVNLSVSNGTLSQSSVWVEQNYVSIKVTAGGSGKVTITATPATGFSDSDANIYNPGSRSVSVNITSGSTSPSKPNTSGSADKKSSDNNLSSLSINIGELSHKFDKNKTEYTLNLPASTEKIIIEGKASDSKAKITGLGETKLSVGNNTIDIIVTAENGSKKTYTIKAYVDETPLVYLNYKDDKIGIIRNVSSIPTLEGFTNNELNIDNNLITIFTKEDISLIYGINEKGEKSFYLFNKDNHKIEDKINQIKINNKDYLISERDNNKNDTININETEITCSKLNSDNYCLLNVLKEDGTIKKYLYEKTENTIQLYNEFKACPEAKSENQNIIIYVLSSIIVLTMGIIVFLIYKIKKGVSNEKTI